jgi:hypothetical protein
MRYKRKSVGASSEINPSSYKFTTEIDWKKSWEELGFFDKMKFFDIWFLVSAGGNFFQLIGAIVAILNETIKARL